MPETAAPQRQPESNVKETVESILVAFILAFIFRAFVVEAFVIPTGSMAPSLYGAHMRFRCPDCGTTFDVGYSTRHQGNSDENDIPSAASRITDYHCPNCGYRFNRDEVQRVRFGDRILVLKYLYLFQKLQRGDTVVFKSPSESPHNPKDPDYSVNYIKRLIGIGPESVVILDGDIYTGPFGSRDARQFKIWRKPAHVQNVLWRTIYDNDFIPHLENEALRDHDWAQPWQAQGASSGWDTGVGGRSRLFHFSGSSGGALAFNSNANADTHALMDYLVYDEWEHRALPWVRTPVSDLKLACTYTRISGDGAFRLQLTKLQDCFTAQITPGRVTLLRSKLNRPGLIDAGPEQTVAEKEVPGLSRSDAARVELVNVDYRVCVRVNGNEVVSYEYDPEIATLWNNALDLSAHANPYAHPQVRITAAAQQCNIEHLQLARDIYYLNGRDTRFWGDPARPCDLKAGEYFVLGDNSFISGDARYWSDPIELPREGMPHVESGRVPEQFMLGKAFFVYWPAGYSVPSTSINIVPDFGDMRFIH